MAENKFGLGRHIPATVAREVRRRCGFGCVICGDAITTYEHFNPPFVDARAHSAAGITLLCGKHQLESSKGILSKVSVAKADADPICLQNGYASHVFDLGAIQPVIQIANTMIIQCENAIRVGTTTLLAARPPEKHSKRWRLSGIFSDVSGTEICKIHENELQVRSDRNDFEQQGKFYTISNSRGVALKLEVDPPARIVVVEADLSCEGARIRVSGSEVKIYTHADRILHLPGGKFQRCRTAIEIDPDGGIGFGSNRP